MSRELVEFFAAFRLTPAQRRIAQTLVEHAGEVTELSAEELAELANVSQPSVTRLAVAVGYSGYAEFRKALRTLKASSVPGSELHEPNEYQRAVKAEVDNLTLLGARLADRDAIREAGSTAMSAETLVITGHGPAAALAAYLGQRASLIHPDVRVHHLAGAMMTDAMVAASRRGTPVLIAFLFAGYPLDTIAVVDTARSLGYELVLITDSQVSPGSDWARVLLRADVCTRLIFDTHAAPLLLSSMLVQAMCDSSPVLVQRRLEELETSRNGRPVYLS